MSWDVDPWGRWRLTARSAEFEAVVEATCAAPGTPLRAPTMDQGLAPFCRDSFCGEVSGCLQLGWSCTDAAMLAGMGEMAALKLLPQC
jgi:tocopherol cyclase